MDLNLSGKTAVVTGAGRGIGRAVALGLGRAGAKVALWNRSLEPAAQAAAELKAAGAEAMACRVDVSQAGQIADAYQTTLDGLGPVDILVNNAGMVQAKTISQISEADWDRVFAVNAKGAFLCSRLVMDGMKQRGWGRIINISSVCSKTGGVSSGAHYCASKAALNCFTLSLARELAPHGVCVNCVAPGPTDTEMLAGISEQSSAEWNAHIPVGRLGKAQDVAGVVLFLASGLGEFITGEILDVNGGMFMD